MWLFINAVTTLVWAGFVFHTSGGEDLILGRYSPSYAGLLAGLTLVWLVIGAWTLKNRSRLRARLGSSFASIGITLLLAVIVLPSAYIYLHSKSLEKSVFSVIKPEAHAFFQIDQSAALPEHVDGALRVLTLGGSTTYGSRLERNEAYPAKLERYLQTAYPDRPIQVVNGGVPWHTSMHSLLRYVSRYADWKPHVVIVLHAFNDIFQSSEGRLTSGTYRSDYGHFFGALGNRVNPRDRLAETIGEVFGNNWLTHTWFSDFRDPPMEIDRQPVDLMRPLPTFKRNLSHLAERITQDGAVAVFMTQPYLYHKNMTQEERDSLFYDYYYGDYALVPKISEQRAAMDQYNLAVIEITKAHHAKLIDLESQLPKTKDWMYDDVHYTIKGAAQVGKIVAENLPWSDYLSELQD